MKLLWHGRWIEAPSYAPTPQGTVISVEASTSVAPMRPTNGRHSERRLRKVVSFGVTDGPAATTRKVRSKQAEGAFSGDYHLVALIGIDPGEERVVALAPYMPACGQTLLAPRALVRTAPDEFDVVQLRAVAEELAARIQPGSVDQSYLYSGMAPPAGMCEALDAAIEGTTPGWRGRGPSILRPVSAEQGDGDVVVRVGVPGGDGAGAAMPPAAVLGAGDYLRTEIAPALASAGVRRLVLCDREPQIASLAAAELGFELAASDAAAAIDALDGRGFVVVATAHDSHARLAAKALEQGHRVCCEKPALVTADDLDLLTAAAAAAPGELEIGFNRRHNPIVQRARRELQRSQGPTTIVATIREVDIERGHWYFWPNQGTRVAGNLCHWIDLALHLIGDGPVPTTISVSGRVDRRASGLDADRTYSIEFDDGSIVTLIPSSRGDSIRGVQEQMEIRRGSLTLRLDDLWRLSGLRSGRLLRSRTLWRDKGHQRMYADALERFLGDEPSSYPTDDIRRVGEVQLAATELLMGEPRRASIAELLAEARDRPASVVTA